MNREYSILLFLIYLRDKQNNYNLKELITLLNMNSNEIIALCSELVDSRLLENNGKLSISDIGLLYLKDNNLSDINFDDLFEKKHTLKIKPDRLDFNDIYIPELPVTPV